MSYGTPEWQGWVLPEQESIQHVKEAYVLLPTNITRADDVYIFSYEAGINTFDTANVRTLLRCT